MGEVWTYAKEKEGSLGKDSHDNWGPACMHGRKVDAKFIWNGVFWGGRDVIIGHVGWHFNLDVQAPSATPVRYSSTRSEQSIQEAWAAFWVVTTRLTFGVQHSACGPSWMNIGAGKI